MDSFSSRGHCWSPFKTRAAYAAAALLALLAQAHEREETVNFGDVSDRIADEQGAVVQDARVVVRQTQTNQTSGLVSDSSGRFRFPHLRVGDYEIVVNRDGFARTSAASRLARVRLVASHAARRGLTTVGVSAATLIETARSQVAGALSQAEVQNLPLNGRNFLDLAR